MVNTNTRGRGSEGDAVTTASALSLSSSAFAAFACYKSAKMVDSQQCALHNSFFPASNQLDDMDKQPMESHP